jgi:hypothetical protein
MMMCAFSRSYVSSLHDGMNLVAKEFVAARTDLKGVLILSEFTGAARELTEALIVNPYDLEGSSDVLRQRPRSPRRPVGTSVASDPPAPNSECARFELATPFR